jgi:hypothetical protein
LAVNCAAPFNENIMREFVCAASRFGNLGVKISVMIRIPATLF